MTYFIFRNMEQPTTTNQEIIINNNLQLSESIDIKQEPQEAALRLNEQQDAMVQIKFEAESSVDATLDTEYLTENVEVKDEMTMDYEKNMTDHLEIDSLESTEELPAVEKSSESDEVVTKMENIENDGSVKEEMSINEDLLVSYDYPNFDDSQSIDSNDIAVLGNVETCLQEELHIKPEMQDGIDVSIS